MLLELANLSVFGVGASACAIKGGSPFLAKGLLPLVEEGWADFLRGADLADGGAFEEVEAEDSDFFLRAELSSFLLVIVVPDGGQELNSRQSGFV